jgi:hypothetical protein
LYRSRCGEELYLHDGRLRSACLGSDCAHNAPIVGSTYSAVCPRPAGELTDNDAREGAQTPRSCREPGAAATPMSPARNFAPWRLYVSPRSAPSGSGGGIIRNAIAPVAAVHPARYPLHQLPGQNLLHLRLRAFA